MSEKARTTKEQDVVMIGAGCAGLVAAIAAAEAGARCTVIEKAPDISDTNTSRSGGSISYAMERVINSEARRRLSPQEKAEEAMRITQGQVQPDLIRMWSENIDDTVEWLRRKGLRFVSQKHLRSLKLEGWAVRALGYGSGLNKQLLSLAEKEGCQVLFSTRAEKLLMDNMGRIAGVRARTVQGMKEFWAPAVVLAMAGFQANQEMLHRYFGPEFAQKVRLSGSPFSTGDGHIMAMEVGAKMVNMNSRHGRAIDRTWVPGSSGMWGPVLELHKLTHCCIFVNKLGKRFMDEVDTGDTIVNSILAQPGQEIAIIFDENIKAVDPKEVEGYRPPEIVMKFNTLEELARGLEVPYEELKKTIAEFNAAVKEGKALGLDVPKRSLAYRIQTPPFYAIYPVWFGFNCTLGGPLITPQAQVVDRDDVPIPGLYAAGEIIGGFFYGNYFTTAGGASYYKGNYQATCGHLSTCVVFGRIAGVSAAGWAAKMKAKAGVGS